MLPGLAFGQGTDYSAGKTPAQLFSGDCSACHKSPRGLAKGRDARALTGFLREHYTTKVQSAGALAAYLVGNPGTPADARNATETRKRGSAAPEEPGSDDVTIAVPEGGRKAREERAARGKGKKPDPAEVAREAAKAAEEAAKAKIHAYATGGESARPLESEPAPPAAAALPAPPVPAPADAAAPRASETPPVASSPAQSSPVVSSPVVSSPAEPAPAAETHSPAEERPATPPPG